MNRRYFLINTAIALGAFFSGCITKKSPKNEFIMKPIKKNVFSENGKSLVSKVKYEKNLKETILESVDLIGGFEKVFRRYAKGDTIMIKPNFNSDDPFPASSDPEFVKAVIELLYEYCAEKVIIGESSGVFWLPTRRVMEKMGMTEVAENTGAELIFFEEGEWIKVDVNGKYLKNIEIAKDALKPLKIVYLPCMKTHGSARFTLSLKLAIGFTNPRNRSGLHFMHLEEKIAELNTIIHPDLIIMDGRKCFITGGPTSGDLREPNLIFASGDRIAIDVEALKVLKSYKANNKLNMPIWEFPQIKRACELNLGARSEVRYKVLGYSALTPNT